MAHLLKLLDKMYGYEMDPTKTVGATEQTWDAGRTDRQMDRQTEGRTDGVKPIYPPTTVGGIKIPYIMVYFQGHHHHIPLQCCLPFKVRQNFDVWGTLTSATNWVGQEYEATGYWCFIKTWDMFAVNELKIEILQTCFWF